MVWLVSHSQLYCPTFFQTVITLNRLAVFLIVAQSKSTKRDHKLCNSICSCVVLVIFDTRTVFWSEMEKVCSRSTLKTFPRALATSERNEEGTCRFIHAAQRTSNFAATIKKTSERSTNQPFWPCSKQHEGWKMRDRTRCELCFFFDKTKMVWSSIGPTQTDAWPSWWENNERSLHARWSINIHHSDAYNTFILSLKLPKTDAIYLCKIVCASAWMQTMNIVSN